MEKCSSILLLTYLFPSCSYMSTFVSKFFLLWFYRAVVKLTICFLKGCSCFVIRTLSAHYLQILYHDIFLRTQRVPFLMCSIWDFILICFQIFLSAFPIVFKAANNKICSVCVVGGR